MPLYSMYLRMYSISHRSVLTSDQTFKPYPRVRVGKIHKCHILLGSKLSPTDKTKLQAECLVSLRQFLGLTKRSKLFYVTHIPSKLHHDVIWHNVTVGRLNNPLRAVSLWNCRSPLCGTSVTNMWSRWYSCFEIRVLNLGNVILVCFISGNHKLSNAI